MTCRWDFRVTVVVVVGIVVRQKGSGRRSQTLSSAGEALAVEERTDLVVVAIAEH